MVWSWSLGWLKGQKRRRFKFDEKIKPVNQTDSYFGCWRDPKVMHSIYLKSFWQGKDPVFHRIIPSVLPKKTFPFSHLRVWLVSWGRGEGRGGRGEGGGGVSTNCQMRREGWVMILLNVNGAIYPASPHPFISCLSTTYPSWFHSFFFPFLVSGEGGCVGKQEEGQQFMLDLSVKGSLSD